MLDAADLLANEESLLAQEQLCEIAVHVVKADKATMNQCLETIQAFQNPLICHRLCLAMLQAVLEGESTRESEFFDQFDAIFPALGITVSGKELIDAWGIDSMVIFIGQVIRLDYQEYLFMRACWPLCRQVGLAVFEWSQECRGHLDSVLEQFVFPNTQHRLRVGEALKLLSPQSMSEIATVESFETAVKQIMGILTPSSDEVESKPSREEIERIYEVWRAARKAARLLSPELLEKNINEPIDSSSATNLLSIISHLAFTKALKELVKDEDPIVCTFAAYYLMDDSHSYLRKHYPRGLESLPGGMLFRSLARAAYSIMNVDRTNFEEMIGMGLQMTEALYATVAFNGMKCREEIRDHFFTKMQVYSINRTVNKNGVSYLELGWLDRKSGHFMWGVVNNALSRWQVKVINTGCGSQNNHHHKPAPSGTGNVRALTKTFQGTDVEGLRSYLTSATQFLHPDAVGNYMIHNKIKPRGSSSVRNRVVLGIHYAGESSDSAADKIYGKGQRSITCVTKAFKALSRCEDPNYDDFHLISKMLAYTAWYGRLYTSGHGNEVTSEFRRSLAKKVYNKVAGNGASPELLEAITRHLITDNSWSFLCVPLVKRVYSSHLQLGNSVQAAAWLRYIFKLALPLGLQCTAEVIDDHVEGRRSFEVAVAALKIFTKHAKYRPTAYFELESRCLNLANFPWDKLKENHYKLMNLILKQMSFSKEHLRIYKIVQTVMSKPSNQVIKRALDGWWPVTTKVQCLHSDPEDERKSA